MPPSTSPSLSLSVFTGSRVFISLQRQMMTLLIRCCFRPLPRLPAPTRISMARSVDTDTGNEHIFRRTCVCLCLSVCSSVCLLNCLSSRLFVFSSVRLSVRLFVGFCVPCGILLNALFSTSNLVAHFRAICLSRTALPRFPPRRLHLLPSCPTGPLHSNLITQQHARCTLHVASRTLHAARRRQPAGNASEGLRDAL